MPKPDKKPPPPHEDHNTLQPTPSHPPPPVPDKPLKTLSPKPEPTQSMDPTSPKIGDGNGAPEPPKPEDDNTAPELVHDDKSNSKPTGPDSNSIPMPQLEPSLNPAVPKEPPPPVIEHYEGPVLPLSKADWNECE